MGLAIMLLMIVFLGVALIFLVPYGEGGGVFEFLGGKSASSIGVIGGADGPTAVFVAIKPSLSLWIIGGVAVLLLLGLVIHRLRKKK
jgi:Na+-transporting methylmalonyl-CoA/oxaloacetate decarboxylase beta subunit